MQTLRAALLMVQRAAAASAVGQPADRMVQRTHFLLLPPTTAIMLIIVDSTQQQLSFSNDLGLPKTRSKTYCSKWTVSLLSDKSSCVCARVNEPSEFLSTSLSLTQKSSPSTKPKKLPPLTETKKQAH